MEGIIAFKIHSTIHLIILSLLHVVIKIQHRRHKLQWYHLFSTHRRAMLMRHKYAIVTCHVAVNFQRPQRSTAIRIYPVVIGRLAEVFVGFTGRLIDSWNKISYMSTAQINGSPDKCPSNISNTGKLLLRSVSSTLE